MKLIKEIKMPCGYMYKLNVSSGFLEMAHYDENDEKLPVCPLHGKECHHRL